MMNTSEYLPTIGLEIHAELKTASKMFCSCKNDPDEEKPNVNICPICLAHPGTLPVLNMEAIRQVLRMGLAVDGKIADFTEWDRKNYFYPDIPKGYQISQYKYPLVSGGQLAGVAIERIHLEEDTAQSTHDTHHKSLVNFNRAGVPLMELVTRPVIHDASTAVAFAKELQLLLRTLGAGEANLEKGEMRVEANISVAPVSESSQASLEKPDLSKLGTKTEVKNLNSFRAVEGAIAYEIERQSSLLREGGKIVQETRGWDDAASETYSQRSKESSHDYRYFPDPDIPKLKISEVADFNSDTLRASLPELPWVKKDRFRKDFAMTEKELAVMIESAELSDYFEQVISPFKSDSKKVRLAVNYLINNYLGKITFGATKKESGEDSGLSSNMNKIAPSSFAELITLIADKTVSSTGANSLIDLALAEKTSFKGSFKEVAEKNGLIQKSDAADLVPAIEKVIADNASVVAEYKSGKVASLQFLIGQCMKATRGAANPEVVKKLLLEKLS